MDNTSVDPQTYHPPEHKLRILIVEDDPSLLQLYTEKFVLENFEVIPARDGQIAYDTLKQEVVDCILLDLIVPKIDGLSVIEKLQSEKVLLPPVLALTNLADPAQKQRALKLGVKDYLVKAMLTPEAVVQKIQEFIKPIGI